MAVSSFQKSEQGEKPAQLVSQESQTQTQQKDLEEINRNIVQKEKQRQREIERKELAKEEKKVKILLLGSKHLASHILYDMRDIARFTVVDQKDPELIFKNPLVEHSISKNDVTMFQFARADIEKNLERLLRGEKYDFIINTISVHDAIYSNINPMDTIETNLVFTQKMMNAILNSSTNAKLLHISTDKVYGDTGVPKGVGPVDPEDQSAWSDKYRKEFMITEDERPNPMGLRAISRYNQELIVSQTAKTYGLGYMIFRIGNIYGRWTPRTNALNQFFINAIQSNSINVYGDKYASRDLIDVEEVAHIIKQTLVTNFNPAAWNEVYNIGGCYPTRLFIDGLAMFVQTIVSGSSVKGLSSQFTEFLLPFGSVKIKYLPARCFEDSEQAAIRIWMDCTKAKDKLKYNPTLGKEWEIGVKETFMWDSAYMLGYDTTQLNDLSTKLLRHPTQ